MPVHFDQLIYTSFAGVGFRVLASTGIPTEIQQAFMQQVVYKHWNSYKPLEPGYRAAYIYQVSLEHNLFGWLYNDGEDDLGRAHVPYFVCYYVAELLQAVQLENIFLCLQRGPVALIERQSLPATLETVVVPDFWSYQPPRIGVSVPLSVRQSSQVALQQGRLLNLFIPVDEPEAVTQLNGQSKKQQSDPVQPSLITTHIPQASLERHDISSVFQGGSEPQIDSFTSDASYPTSPNKSALLVGIGIGFASSLALIGTVYGILQWQPGQNLNLLKPFKSVRTEFYELKKGCCKLKANYDFFRN